MVLEEFKLYTCHTGYSGIVCVQTSIGVLGISPCITSNSMEIYTGIISLCVSSDISADENM